MFSALFSNYLPFMTFTICLFMCSLSESEIRTDGTLAPVQNLQGPNYAIDDRLGQQYGSNLFHSFDVFNVYIGERVTFSGPSSVENIIGRVTGGTASLINGELRCSIPGANLYLLNPAGFIFGENAKLDLSGSLHVSTADYVRLGINGRFDTIHPENSSLTWEPVTSFGFIDNHPASIQLNGFSDLFVEQEQSFSLVGGDIIIDNSAFQMADGRLTIAAVASRGEFFLDDMPTGSFDEMADITIRDTFFLVDEIDFKASGGIYIRGNNIIVESSSISTVTDSDNGNGVIDIIARENLTMKDGARVYEEAVNFGVAADIDINADVLTIENHSQIMSDTDAGSQGASIRLNVGNLEITGGGNISGRGAGIPGDLTIDICEDVVIAGGNFLSLEPGAEENWMPSHISLHNSDPNLDTNEISIHARSLSITDGGIIFTNTGNDNNSSNININTGESIIISGFGPDKLTNVSSIQSNAYASGNAGEVNIQTQTLKISDKGSIESFSGSSGDASTVDIRANTISIEDEGSIVAFTTGLGKGADVNLRADSTLQIRSGGGINSSTYSDGSAGNISINAPHVKVAGEINCSSYDAGNSGEIEIHAQNVEIDGKGAIAANAEGSGKSSHIDIETGRLVVSEGGRISACAKTGHPYKSAMLPDSSVGGVGGAINIIAHDSVTVTGMDTDSELGSSISVDTNESGNAGDIRIKTGRMTVENGASISAESSANGVAGNIVIDAGRISITKRGKVSSQSASVDGGNVVFNVEGLFYMDGSVLAAEVDSGQGNGGNVFIDSILTVLRKSEITAKAIDGNGGNISIITDNYLKDSLSVIDASSQLGIDGNVGIVTPTLELSSIALLPNTFGTVNDLSTNPCAVRSARDSSSLIVRKKRRPLFNPEDYLTAQ